MAMAMRMRTELEYVNNHVDYDAESYVDEDDLQEVRLHHWLNDSESVNRMEDSGVTRADSPLLGFDHLALMSGRDAQLADKPLPELPPSLSRLRSHSAASSTVTHHPISKPAPVAAPAAVLHRRRPSNSSSSSAPSRRPSLAQRPSLALLSESMPLPPPVARESGRLHSIASSLSIGANRNAVYIDSAQVSSRLDEWLTSAERAVQPSVPPQLHAPPPNTPMSPYFNPPASLSQIYVGRNPQGKRGDRVTSSLSARGLASQPSFASLSHHLPSASSIGLAYQNTPPLPLCPSPPTASRWSLTSSVAEHISREKKKAKGGARKRLASIISRFTGHSPHKGAKQQPQPEPEPEPELAPVPPALAVRSRSTSNVSFNPPPKIKSKSKPPSLKLQPSSPAPPSPRSPIPSTPIPPSVPSKVVSPVVASFTPASPSPVKASFPSGSTRFSVSTSTTSTNTASPLMPTTPVLNDSLLSSPALKNAVSVPVLSHAYEGPGLIRRDGNFREHVPLSRSKTYDDEDLEADAKFHAPRVNRRTAEDERNLRLGVITDMLDRDLNGAPQPSPQLALEPSHPQGLVNQPRDYGRIGVVDRACHSSRTSPLHFRASSTVSRSSSIQRRSVSGPQASSLNVSPPPLPIRNGFRSLAARMGITNIPSSSQSLAGPDPKRKPLARLISNGKRKASKRRLVISGVGHQQEEVDAVTEWCASIGEIRTMVKLTDHARAAAQDGPPQDVWIVDFKKSSIVESVTSPQGQITIKGAGTVRISWETATKPKLGFKMGWIP